MEAGSKERKKEEKNANKQKERFFFFFSKDAQNQTPLLCPLVLYNLFFAKKNFYFHLEKSSGYFSILFFYAGGNKKNPPFLCLQNLFRTNISKIKMGQNRTKSETFFYTFFMRGKPLKDERGPLRGALNTSFLYFFCRNISIHILQEKPAILGEINYIPYPTLFFLNFFFFFGKILCKTPFWMPHNAPFLFLFFF